MKKFIFLLIVCFILLLTLTCTNYIWTGQEYTGTLDKNDTVDDAGDYYDTWNIGCSGTWTITLKSSDNVLIHVSIKDPTDSISYYSMSTSSSVTHTYKMEIPFICKVWVDEYDQNWIANGRKVSYKISAVIK